MSSPVSSERKSCSAAIGRKIGLIFEHFCRKIVEPAWAKMHFLITTSLIAQKVIIIPNNVAMLFKKVLKRVTARNCHVEKASSF